MKIIIDTDIGADIDDTWALMLALSDPFFEIVLISVTQSNILHKAQLVADMLERLGKTHIPIALGKENGEAIYPQKNCLNGFSFDNYKGRIYQNCTTAYAEILKQNPDTAVVALGPFTTLASVLLVLKQYNTPIYAMAGSIYQGYWHRPEISPECNIVSDIPAAKAVFKLQNKIVLLPLDVCNSVRIFKEKYKAVRESKSKYALEAMRHYAEWDCAYVGGSKKYPVLKSSTILYDLVPFWFIKFPGFFKCENLSIIIDNSGYTKANGKGDICCAVECYDLNTLLDYTVASLTKNC